MKRENRGGARAGAGRPKQKKEYSEKVKKAYLKAAKKLATEYGMPIEEAILSMVYASDVQDTVKVACMKLYNEALLVKESEVSVSKSNAPAVYLPERKKDPAKIVQLKEARA